jgi:demethylmenaquinone methyltransferase/2-methoxy-6-polyprenyl-1,4-benzoquinol methylase
MLSRRSFSVLDSATGTGNLAFAVYENAREKGKLVKVEATDFVPQMLAIARAKAKRMGIDAIRFKTSDSLKTSYKNNSFDVITTGFSLRNFDDVNRFLSESHRILRRNGKLVILELALPDRTMQRLNFRIYSYFIRFTSLFAGRAYNWFVDSINNFDKHALRVRIRNAGFKNVRMRELASGVAFLLTAEK